MFIAAIAIYFGLVVSGLAWNRGLSTRKWLVLGFVFGPLALAVTFFPWPSRTKIVVHGPPRRKCSRCGWFVDDDEPEPCSSCRSEIMAMLGYSPKCRTWTACGSPVTARLVFIDGEEIEVRKGDGTPLILHRSDLSFDDLSYLDQCE